MKALRIYAGPRALAHLRAHGLAPSHVRAIPAAAGGPKGLTLLPLDRFLFGEWLAGVDQPVDLIGASIGAWRMAAAMLNDPVAAIDQLQHAYIHQQFEVPPGRRMPTREHVSERFAEGIRAMFGARVDEVLTHPRYRLHVLTSRGRHVLRHDGRVRAPLGYAGAFLTNLASRRAMGGWLERAVFSSHLADAAALPFAAHDYRTRRYALTAQNFEPVVQASCSIPFVLDAVTDIPGAPPGAYWDGGITDYHLHLDYRRAVAEPQARGAVVLYPHFQRAVVPGWLDKSLRWRHHASRFLDDVIVLAPDGAWVARLPNGKLPDRTDFARYGTDLAARVAVWRRAVAESEQLRDDFAQWLEGGADVGEVGAL
ncbi:MAG: phospholipase [Burkholderiales bacterium]|nr:phospholipase [Burkholderiales bacterium]